MDANKRDKFVELYYKILQSDHNIGLKGNLDEILYNLLLEMENAISSGCEGTLFMDEDAYDTKRAEYLSKLLLILSRIENNNLEDKVLNACILFTHLRDNRSYIPDALEAHFFPQDAYLKDKQFYYSLWDDIIRSYIEDTIAYMDYKYIKTLDPKIKQLIDEYINFGKNTEISPSNWRQNTLFNKYANIIIPYYYKEGYDIGLLPKVLDYAFNNAFDIEEHLILNTGNDNEYAACSNIIDFDEGIVNRIINGAMGNNIIIR